VTSSGAFRLLVLSDASSAHTERWVRALAARGHVISLYSLSTPAGDAYADLKNVTVQSLGLPISLVADSEGALSKARYLKAIRPIRDLIKTFAPDVVHAHYVTSYGLLATLAGARPRILSAWGMDVYGLASRSVLYRKFVSSVLGSADLILSTSNVMRSQIGLITQRAVEVTPFGVDTEKFCPRPLSATSDDSVITVGLVKALESKYGIEYLLQSFKIVTLRARSNRSYRLLLVGDGSMRSKLEKAANQLGISDKVQFAGQCSYDEIQNWHQCLDIAVYPSIDASESFGVAAVESQSCAVPVIVSDIGGLPEVVVNEQTGLVVPPKNVEELAEAILRLGQDSMLRKQMGERARRHVIEHFSLSDSVRLMETMYRKVSVRSRLEHDSDHRTAHR